MFQAHIFNIHDVVQLITASLALLLAVPLALKPRHPRSDRAFAAFLFTQGFISLYFLVLYSDVIGPVTTELLAPFEFLPLVILHAIQGPVLLWYGYAMAGQAVKWHRVDLIAIACITGPNMLMFLILADGDSVPFTHFMYPAFSMVVSMVFGIRALLVFRHNDKKIRQRFSNIDDISLAWLAWATFGFVGVWIFRVLGAGVIANYPVLFLVAAIVVLGLNRRPQGPTPYKIPGGHGLGVDSGEDHVDESKEIKISPEKAARLEDLMARVKVYQDPNLGLDDLADSMGISPRSLSTLINSQFDKNFYDFVNHYRVEDASRQLSDPELADKPIQRIFEDAGFNSKSTFNTIFKKVTGRTPSAYRKLHSTPIARGRAMGPSKDLAA